MHRYRVPPRKDKRGVERISDVLLLVLRREPPDRDSLFHIFGDQSELRDTLRVKLVLVAKKLPA